MRWYADNSELHGTKDSVIPDILIFGGLMIETAQENVLRKSVERIKKKHCGYDRAPIKWNMRDLESLYKSQNMEQLYKDLFASSQTWRREIFDEITKTECLALVSCIEGYSADRQVLKDKKDELTGMVFSNALMRYGLHVKGARSDSAAVVLDWPDKGKSRPFDKEYASAYSRGTTSDKNVRYSSGTLSSLGFCDSIYYSNMSHSTMLQLADLVVGATREFIDFCLKQKRQLKGFLAPSKFPQDSVAHQAGYLAMGSSFPQEMISYWQQSRAASRRTWLRPNNSFKPKPLRGSA